MKHIFLILVLLASTVVGQAWAKDEPATDAPAADTETEAGIAWADDYESAQEKAKAENKGLFIYMTPTWFTCGYCARLEGGAYEDEDVQNYINEHFVPLKIEEVQNDLMAKRLGIAQEGYPNVAIYGAGDEYLGRVIGFGGTDSWFGQLKDRQAVGEQLAELNTAAEKDPKAWLEVAAFVAKIPDRSADALAILDKVPAKLQKSDEYKQVRAGLKADAAWAEAHKGVLELMQGVRSREAAVSKAGDIIEKIDAFLADHGETGAEAVAAALSAKGFFLGLSGQDDKALEVLKTLFQEFPDSPQVKGLVNALTWR